MTYCSARHPDGWLCILAARHELDHLSIDNRVVWLCWRYGEESIEFYHELDGGFAKRKSLADVRKRMLN